MVTKLRLERLTINRMLKKVKVGFVVLPLLLLMSFANGQIKTITIEDCYRLAQENFPLIKRQALIQKSKEYSIEIVSKGYLPQVNINGQASYQSEVTQIPIQIPNNPIPTLSKDQYRLYGELSQVLFDGGIIKSQKESQEAASKVEEQQLKVELYALKNRINQLYFGILLINQQLAQNQLLKKDIQLGIEKVEAAIQNGTSLRSGADALKAELLNAEQRKIELDASKKAFIDMLSMFIQQPLTTEVNLVQPLNPSLTEKISRPELSLFDFKNQSLQIQQKMLRAKNLPKLNFFAQGGAGRPALNMLSNNLEAYYLFGLRMTIPLTGLYTFKDEKAAINIKQQDIEIQKEVFLFNTQLELKQQSAEIAKFRKLLLSDDEIVVLRNNIKKTALAQLENGVITSNDYIKETLAEDQARQRKNLHEVQLLMAKYDSKTTEGS